MNITQFGNQLKVFFASHYGAILVGCVVLHLLRNKYKRWLWNLPGPPIAGFSNLWRFYLSFSGKNQQVETDLHQKYGPVVRLGPNVVSVGDPKAIPVIYSFAAGYNKSDFFSMFKITYKKKSLSHLVTLVDNAAHRKMKRPLANAYAMTSILEMEGCVDSCVEDFRCRLDDFALSTESVDFGTWLQYFAFDVVGEITFNKKLGFLEKGEDVDGIIGTIKTMIGIGFRSAQMPPLHTFLLGNPFLRFIPAVESANSVLKFTLKVVESRRSLGRKGDLVLGEEGGRDILSRWIAVNAKDPTQLTTEHIIANATANVMAGSDTTAIVLRAIFYHLLRHPRAMEKLVREIDHANEAGLLSSIVSYKEAATHLPYLRAVIKEGMRIHPSVGMLLTRVVPAGGVEICGSYLPANTIVGMNPWVVQHDPKVFPDPDMFIPERWIENSQDRLKEMEASMFLFGSGSRVCIGKFIAVVQFYKLVPEILRRYTITLAHPEKDWTVTACLFTQQTGLICKFTRRSKPD